MRERALHNETSRGRWPVRLAALRGHTGAALADAWAELKRSLLPADDAEARVVDRQLDLLRENTRLIPYAIPVAALAGAAAVSKWVTTPVLVVWFVLLAAAAALHEAASRYFEKHPRATPPPTSGCAR